MSKNTDSPGLTWAEIEQAAATLGLEPCLVQAVVEVESNGKGFLPSGRPTLLYEGHQFWKELRKVGINPERKDAPDILYRRWDKSKYKGGEGEWDRLEKAMAIHKEAALKSASWGLFQIMGFNHAACGFASVLDFVEAQKKSLAAQLDAFCAFMRHEGLVPLLQKKDWSGFARRYNGPEYAKNSYHTKLQRAHQRCLEKQEKA